MTHFTTNNVYDDNNTIFLSTRSFDINKPGTIINDLKGGVIGGSLLSGKLKIGDIIEIKPGIEYTENNVKKYKTIVTVINSIKSDKLDLEEAYPGGLLALGTDIDNYYCKNDKLAGNYISTENKLPNLSKDITMNYELIEDFDGVWKPKKNEILNLQIGQINTDAQLISVTKKNLKLKLNKPICLFNNNIIISKKDNFSIKIIGMGHPIIK